MYCVMYCDMKRPASVKTRERTDYFHFPITLYQMISFFGGVLRYTYLLLNLLQGMVSFQGLVVGCWREKGVEEEVEEEEER